VQRGRGRRQTSAAGAVGWAGGEAVQPSWSTRQPRRPMGVGRQGMAPALLPTEQVAWATAGASKWRPRRVPSGMPAPGVALHP